LIVQIHVAPDRFFRREGLDLIGVVPINLAQALLGSRIKVKTLDDKRVVLRIPPGRSMARNSASRGMHREERPARRHVRGSARHAPEKLSVEEQESLKNFAERRG